MTGFSPTRGGALLVPSGPTHDPDRKHLYVLLTDPVGQGQQILMVPICSVEPDKFCDDTCLLAVGEHQFLQHESYVAYAKCRVEAALHVLNLVGSGYFIPKDPLSDSIVVRMCNGLATSKFVKPFVRDFYRDYEQSLLRASNAE